MIHSAIRPLKKHWNKAQMQHKTAYTFQTTYIQTEDL